jgi:hypothetical protein
MGDFAAHLRNDSPARDVAVQGDDVAPGRRASTNDLTAPTGHVTTGDAHIDHATTCDIHDRAAGCFLDSIQRTRLVAAYQARVGRALSSYQEAITRETIDKLLEKDDDLVWIASLLIGVATDQIGTAIAAALKAIRGRVTKSLLDVDAVAQLSDRRYTWLNRLDNVSEDTLKKIGKAPADSLKDLIKGTLKDRQNAQAKTDRDAATDYLDRLQAASSAIFERYAEDPPQTATDAELLVLYRAWSAEDHNPRVYRMLVHAQVERYKASNARRIGLQRTGPFDTQQKDTHTKVGWIKVPSGGVRLAYFAQDFDAGDPAVYHDDADRMAKPPGDALDVEPRFVDFVEPEFVGVAMERHLQLWGTQPKTYEYSAKTFPMRLREVGSSTTAELAGEMTGRAERIRRATDMTLPGVK